MRDAIGGAPVGVVKAGARYRLDDVTKGASQPRIEVAVEVRLQSDRLNPFGAEKIKAEPKFVGIFLVITIKRFDTRARSRQRVLLACYSPGEECRQTIERFGENGCIDFFFPGEPGIDGARRAARLRRDHPDRCALEADALEHAAGGVDDHLTPGVPECVLPGAHPGIIRLLNHARQTFCSGVGARFARGCVQRFGLMDRFSVQSQVPWSRFRTASFQPTCSARCLKFRPSGEWRVIPSKIVAIICVVFSPIASMAWLTISFCIMS